MGEVLIDRHCEKEIKSTAFLGLQECFNISLTKLYPPDSGILSEVNGDQNFEVYGNLSLKRQGVIFLEYILELI